MRKNMREYYNYLGDVMKSYGVEDFHIEQGGKHWKLYYPVPDKSSERYIALSSTASDRRVLNITGGVLRRELRTAGYFEIKSKGN